MKTIKAHELESNVEKSFLFAPLFIYLFLFRGFHQAQLHFTNIYNRYESKDEGSANGHEVPARQTPTFDPICLVLMLFRHMSYGNELVLVVWVAFSLLIYSARPNINLFKAWTGGVLTNSWNYCLKTFFLLWSKTTARAILEPALFDGLVNWLV